MNGALINKRETILIKETRGKSNIVIGAPHHAPGGKKTLCEEHPDSDENTGFIASGIAELLNAHVVIACNAKVDPNKKLSTDYSKQIIEWAPRYLIEIHGHGGKRVKPNIIEVSCGSKEKSGLSEKFAEVLDAKFKEDKRLKEFLVKGDFDDLIFQAKKTATIIDDRWTGYHIELPPSLRINEKNDLPDGTSTLVHCLVDTIKEICN